MGRRTRSASRGCCHVGQEVCQPEDATARVVQSTTRVTGQVTAAFPAGVGCGHARRPAHWPKPWPQSPFFAGLDAARPSSGSPAACAPGGSGAARSSSISATRATRCSSSCPGEVKISLPSETGDEAILATLRPGDVFGELALLDGAPRSASASRSSRRRPSILPRDQFRELIATEAGVRDALLASIAGGAAAADHPRRGAPLPRHHRAPRVAPRPARATKAGTPTAGRRDPAARRR